MELSHAIRGARGARDTSGQEFANFDVKTEVENANLRSQESGSY